MSNESYPYPFDDEYSFPQHLPRNPDEEAELKSEANWGILEIQDFLATEDQNRLRQQQATDYLQDIPGHTSGPRHGHRPTFRKKRSR